MLVGCRLERAAVDRDRVVELVDRLKIRGLGYLVLLYWLNAATVSELRQMTGDDRHIISDCLIGLELRHFVLRVQVGRAEQWRLSQEGFLLLSSVGGGNTTINASTTTTAISAIDSKPVAAAAARLVGGKTTNKPPEIDPALADAFRAAGLGTNIWAELAGLEWVTPELVRAHDAYRRSRREKPGMLVTRLRCNDLVPELPGEGEDDDYRGWPKPRRRASPSRAIPAAPVADDTADGDGAAPGCIVGADGDADGCTAEDGEAPDWCATVRLAICDRIYARDPQFFFEVVPFLSLDSTAGGRFLFGAPWRLHRSIFDHERKLVELLAELFEDDTLSVSWSFHAG